MVIAAKKTDATRDLIYYAYKCKRSRHMGEMSHECRVRNKRCDYEHTTQWRGKIYFLTTKDIVTNHCLRSQVMCRVRKGMPRFRGEYLRAKF